MSAATTTEPTNAEVFASAAEKAAEMSEYLSSKEALGRRHEDLEDYAEREGREWIRRMLQGHYDLRGAVERVVRARGRDGVLRTFLRPSSRPMLSIVGALDIARLAYQAQGVEGLHPMDAALNLPRELYSHMVRRAVGDDRGKARRFDRARRDRHGRWMEECVPRDERERGEVLTREVGGDVVSFSASLDLLVAAS